jgi:hypothetical protein
MIKSYKHTRPSATLKRCALKYRQKNASLWSAFCTWFYRYRRRVVRSPEVMT